MLLEQTPIQNIEIVGHPRFKSVKVSYKIRNQSQQTVLGLFQRVIFHVQASQII